MYLCLCVCLTTNVLAQTQKTYPLHDLISIALESSPQVLAARDQARAIRGQLSIARAIPNPEFEAST